MEVRRNNGMTEFIPTPAETRESAIRDNVLELLDLLHMRLVALEKASGISSRFAEQFERTMQRIRDDEARIQQITGGQ